MGQLWVAEGVHDRTMVQWYVHEVLKELLPPEDDPQDGVAAAWRAAYVSCSSYPI